jgi:outer membrane protein assembly factor BamA
MRLLALALALLLAATARADEPPDEAVDLGDTDFGPLVEIERIVVTGNDITAEKLIRRALLVADGDRLRAGDPRFQASRFRVLALGYFRDVQLRLDKGTRRGAVILTVSVVERETLVLNRLDLGTSDETAIWFGLDVGATNLFGSGIGGSIAAIYASAPRLPGGTPQLGLRLRLADQAVLGSPVGVHGSFLYNDASEAADGVAVHYHRVGGTLGASFDLSRTSYLSADARVEHIDPSDSWLVAVALGADFDTRSDPILPAGGQHAAVVAQLGLPPLGSSWDELKLRARWEGWLQVAPRHVLSLHVDAGILFGTVPSFDQFYIGDLNPLLTDRKLDLVVSTRPSPDFFGSGIKDVRYGELELGLAVEYAYQLFRGAKTIYGGDLFASVGLIALGPRADPRADLTFNFGLRVDTAIGVVELSLSNLLGRIPW